MGGTSSAGFLLPNDCFLTVLHPVFVSFWLFQKTLGENILREVSHYCFSNERKRYREGKKGELLQLCGSHFKDANSCWTALR